MLETNGVSTPPMTTHTAFVTLSRIYHILCVQKSFRQGKAHCFLILSISLSLSLSLSLTLSLSFPSSPHNLYNVHTHTHTHTQSLSLLSLSFLFHHLCYFSLIRIPRTPSLSQALLLLLVMQCLEHLLSRPVGVQSTQSPLHCCLKEKDPEAHHSRHC